MAARPRMWPRKFSKEESAAPSSERTTATSSAASATDPGASGVASERAVGRLDRTVASGFTAFTTFVSEFTLFASVFFVSVSV